MATAPDPTDVRQAPAWTVQLAKTGNNTDVVTTDGNGKITVNHSVSVKGNGIWGRAS